MKFITFCRVEPPGDFGYSPYYVLAELGMIEYSLAEGIIDEYHTFIKPNTVPVGYLSKCLDSSRDYHKIPFNEKENSALIDKGYYEIYRDLSTFLSKKVTFLCIFVVWLTYKYYQYYHSVSI